MTQAYLYKWIHIPTSKWYIGARYAKEAHPQDGYICSSKKVKPLIQANPEEWVKKILCIGHPEDMVKLEADYLQLLNAKDDPQSWNFHNGNGKFRNKAGYKLGPVPFEVIQKRIKTVTGTKRSEETRKKMSLAQLGRKRSEETRRKMSLRDMSYCRGIPRSEETKEKIRKGLLGGKILTSGAKIREKLKGIPKPPEVLLKRAETVAEKNRINRVSCIHCHREFVITQFSRHKKCKKI